MSVDAQDDRPKRTRKNQPQCEECSHPISFHGGGSTRCRALGCHCEMWQGEAPEPQAAAASS